METEQNPEIKTIIVEIPEKEQKIIKKKEKKKRKIVLNPIWKKISQEQQVEFIEQKFNDEKIKNLFFQQIQKKLAGYKTQDIKKKRYSPDNFIQKDDLLKLLNETGLICKYCCEPIILLYENVREPKQWSLDRINNDIGHNTDNVCIACLSCNLKRKTIYYERYLRAKQQQLVFVKLNTTEEKT